MDAFAKREYLTQAERFGLKSATELEVEDAGGPTEVARHCRLDAGRITRSYTQTDTSFMPIDAVIVAGRLSGKYHILRDLADRCGFELVAKDKRSDAPSLMRDCGIVSCETGRAVHEIIEAESDNVITPKEGKPIDARLRGLESVIASMRRKLHGRITLIR